MKLSKPEDMDNFGEKAREQNGGGSQEPPKVEVFGEVMPVSEAIVQLARDVDSQAATDVVVEEEVSGVRDEVEELRAKVAQQERAIAELADVVESLSQAQAKRTGKLVVLDREPFSGIYDPTREFEHGN